MSDAVGRERTSSDRGASSIPRAPPVVSPYATPYQDVPPHISMALLAHESKEEFKVHDGLHKLEHCIRLYRRAVQVTPDNDLLQVTILESFAEALDVRFQRLGDRVDLDESITTRQAVDALTPEGSPNKVSRLTTFSDSMWRRFNLKGNFQDLGEAMLLATRALHPSPKDEDMSAMLILLSNLSLSIQRQLRHPGFSKHLKKAFTLQRSVNALIPVDHPDTPIFLDTLSDLLYERFLISERSDLADLEESIVHQLRSNELTPDYNPDTAGRLSSLGYKLLARFSYLGHPGDIEHAIASSEHAVRITPDAHEDKASRFTCLGDSLHARFTHAGDTGDLVRAIAYKTQAVDLSLDSHLQKPTILASLGNSLLSHFDVSGDLDELNKAVSVYHRALELTPEDDARKAGLLYNLACLHRARLKETGAVTDLTEAIECSAQLLRVSYPNRVGKRASLHSACLISLHTQYPEDLPHNIEASFQGTKHLPLLRDLSFRVCGLYTDLLSNFSHLLDVPPKISLLQAYKLQINLILQFVSLCYAMQEVFTLAISTAAAAAAIATGEHVQALEWLEAGRTLVWSEIFQRHTWLVDLRLHSPELAARLDRVLLQLGYTTTSRRGRLTKLATSLETISDIRVIMSSHTYAIEYEKLITEIRGIEGFSGFLQPKRLSQLAAACSSGPVVVINMHPTRCDALILFSLGEVAHIPLPTFSLEHAGKLLNDLSYVLSARHLYGFRAEHQDTDSDARLSMRRSECDDRMFKVLADLWIMVVKPIIDFIRTLPDTSKPPHVTWCPTGPLAFLPLHAAGIYHYNRAPSETVMDFVISSYTPTLDALLNSRARLTSPRTSPRVLVVSQPKTAGGSPTPGTTTEAEIVTALTGLTTRTLHGADGTVDAVLEAMAHHDWVHLACHGIQNHDNPLESCFVLYDGKLSLSTLMSKHLPHAGLAVLSGCQTAMGDPDAVKEVVDLAAGMLSVGYKSVIGTMWSIYDDSAPIVMGKFYEVMMEQVKNGGELQPAYALHEAAKALRDEYGVNDFVRWVPFVHFGL